MACNVFGDPITDETLKALPKYKNVEIDSKIRGDEAFHMKNIGGKNVKALNYALSQKNDWDSYVEKMIENSNLPNKTCCIVLIYNATGDTLTYTTSHDFKGNIGRSPYPSRIANGQWGAFLHVQTLGSSNGCQAAVVYRGTISFKKSESKPKRKLDWMLGWYNPGTLGSSHIYPFAFSTMIYGEVRAPDHFKADSVWKDVSDNMKKQHSLDEPKQGEEGYGGAFEGTTGKGVASIYEAILKLGKKVE